MILKLLSLLFFYLLVRAAFSLFRLLGVIRNTADRMKDQLGGTYGGQQDAGDGVDSQVYGGRQSQSSKTKIIPSDEGEYVEYEEV